MKFIFLFAVISISAFASGTSYEFTNFSTADDFNFQEVISQKEISIVVFNRGYCPINDSKFDCFPFETKLEYLSPKIIGNYSNAQIINIDIERNYIQQRYNFQRFPAVVFLLSGREVERIDTYSNANDLIIKTFETLSKFPSN